MKILFCNIAWMEMYKGIYPGNDTPKGGGKFVQETGLAGEAFNFKPEYLPQETGYEEGEYCLGFVETKHGKSGSVNQLKIENIEGCEVYKNDRQVEDVLVVFCATYPYTDKRGYEGYVVGWYRNATVYRYYDTIECYNEKSKLEWQQDYNIIAKKEDCVLLPVKERRKSKWSVKRTSTGASYGFGMSEVWYARGREDNKLLDTYLNNLVKSIDEYKGENWVDKPVPENWV